MNKYKNSIIIALALIFIVLLTLLPFSLKDGEISHVEPIEEPIPYADYDWSNLDGDVFLTYEDENYTSVIGIDVAAHQNTIDWAKVKQAGIEFAYLRIGYRGATQGLLHVDDEFENNYLGATQNGIKVGVYFYSQAITRQEAKNEATYVIRVLGDKKLDLPIVFDYEEPIFYDGDISRMHDVSPLLRTRIAQSFLDEIKNHGYDTMIYTNKDWAINYYDSELLLNNDIWYAQYDTLNPSIVVPFKIWQYTDEATIDGIDTTVDLNIMFIRKNDQSE